MSAPLLEVEGLVTTFPGEGGERVPVVDGVGFVRIVHPGDPGHALGQVQRGFE